MLTVSGEDGATMFCKNFDDKTCVVPIRAIFDIDGNEIRPAAKETGKKGERKQRVFEASNRIFLLKQGSSHYRLITGMRELQSKLLKGSDLVSAVVYDVDAEAFFKLADCVSRLQKESSMHFFEYASLLGEIIELTGIKQAELAAWLRISQPSVGNKLRLLAISADVREASIRARLTERHCRALLGLDTPETQLRAINYILKYNISSKAAESITKYMQSKRRLGVTDEEYRRIFDNVFLQATVDTKSEITDFQNNLMREVRILRSLGIDVVFSRRDKNTYWDIEITLPKSA